MYFYTTNNKILPYKEMDYIRSILAHLKWCEASLNGSSQPIVSAGNKYQMLEKEKELQELFDKISYSYAINSFSEKMAEKLIQIARLIHDFIKALFVEIPRVKEYKGSLYV